jgi:hypothetical protein
VILETNLSVNAVSMIRVFISKKSLMLNAFRNYAIDIVMLFRCHRTVNWSIAPFLYSNKDLRDTKKAKLLGDKNQTDETFKIFGSSAWPSEKGVIYGAISWNISISSLENSITAFMCMKRH